MGNCSSEVSSQVSVSAHTSAGTITSHNTGLSTASSSRTQSSRRKYQHKGNSSGSFHNDAPPKRTEGKPLSAENQLRWNHFFQKGKHKIIDPEDVHIVLDTNISSCINRLQSGETTLILRRVRKVVGMLTNPNVNTNKSSSLGYGNAKKMKAPVDDTIRSRAIYQKDHLIDLNVMRTIFIAGDRWINRGRAKKWMDTSLISYLRRMNGNRNADSALHVDSDGDVGTKKGPDNGNDKGTVNGNGNTIQEEKIEDGQGDLVASAYTILLHLSEPRWDHAQAIASISAERAGLVLDANKQMKQTKKEKGKRLPSPLPPSIFPFGEENAAGVPPPTLPNGVSFQGLTLLIAYSLRCSRRQRLNLLFHLLLGSDKLTEILKEHPAGGLPSWIVDFDQDWKLSYGSLGHEYYYEDAIRIDALVAIETIGILLHNAPPPGPQTNAETEAVGSSPSSRGNRKRALSYGDKKYHEAKMHIMLSGYLRQVRSGTDSPVFENTNEQKKQTGLLDSFWKASADIYSRARQKTEEKSSGSMQWTLAEFMDWAKSAIPDDLTLDIIMHHVFGMGLLPTPSMERKLVADSWIEWQLRELHLFDEAENNDVNAAISAMTNGIRHLLNFSNRDNDKPPEPSSMLVLDNTFDINGSAVWGGIGGFDGKGGLGNGIMYCIDKKWWADWEAYVGWEWYDGGSDSTSRTRPRELSSEPLLDRSSDFFLGGSKGSYELMKQNLTKNDDYVLVPPCVWDILYELYGGGPPLPRMILTTKKFSDNSSIDVGIGDRFQKPNKIPKTLCIATHPWVIECQVCVPHQPYRRGDIGPMSIRLMATSNQPLWRLFAEIVLRLPIVHPRGKNSDGKGRGRLWKNFEVKDGSESVEVAPSSFGPWELLIQSGAAEFPVGENMDMDQVAYDSFVNSWDEYADHATVGSLGLQDNSRLMFEYALVGKDEKFTWPREAAEKAGIRSRDNAEDLEFRRTLRGVDANSNLVTDVKKIIGTVIDAMDSAGRWYQAEIADIDCLKDKRDYSEDSSSDSENVESDESRHPREIRAVKIDFRDVGGHEQWILIGSDRLATKGRYTKDSIKSIRLEQMDDTPAGKHTNGESKTLGFVLKHHTTKEPTPFQLSSSVCSFPGFGACGLANMGNTCYANSAVQCMSYMPLLRSYLLSNQFKKFGDINKDNPLGTGGRLLEEFASLQQLMWSAKLGVRTPTKFRAQLARALQQYAGADQQDAQELLNDLLDALHEDSNKVAKKPYVEALEDEWVESRTLSKVGEESWRRFLRRNRSIIANIAMGQVLNRVTCPACNYTSRNFDPFNMLSIPFPTVSDVVFRCQVLRRATPYNCPKTLGLITDKTSSWQSKTTPPPSEHLILEEYTITLSRLADIGDLKENIHKLCGISLNRLKLFVLDEHEQVGEEDSPQKQNNLMNLSAIPEKEGPCLQFARESSNGELLSPAEVPTAIYVFETTLKCRTSNGENIQSSGKPVYDLSSGDKECAWKIAQQELEHFSNTNECRSFDQNPNNLAKAVSQCMWPELADQVAIGLRVDAVDHRGHWFPGSVVDISQDASSGAVVGDDGENQGIKVKVHFDNFSSKWDLDFTFSDFVKGGLQPLYSHCRPKVSPLDFQVFHGTASVPNDFFGYPFFLQCYSEWSVARTGAHILSQASRFIERSRKGTSMGMKDVELNKMYRDSRNAVANVIDTLLEADQDFVRSAISLGRDDVSVTTLHCAGIIKKFKKKLPSLLTKLPFDLIIRDTKQTPGESEEFSFKYEYTLDQSIGNIMNAQNGVVLQWKNVGRSVETLYAEPSVNKEKSTVTMNGSQTKDSSVERSIYAHGGMRIGACLDEFCKEQNLDQADCWRCPKCKDVREGRQSMTLWRLPDLLTFHLKRFNCSARWREKITTKVNFPLTGLDMKEWCDNDSPLSSDGSIYDLVGVVNHYGGMTGGHYVATCKVTSCSPNGSEEVEHNFNGAGVHAFDTKEKVTQTASWKLGRSKDKDSTSLHTRAALSAAKTAAESSEPLWLQFDDDSVEPIPPRSVNTESAYVLFYRRRQISPSNIARYSTMD